MLEVIQRLTAIKNFAKDCHYNFDDYSQHLLADVNMDEIQTYIDILNEVAFLGTGIEAPSSKIVMDGAKNLLPITNIDGLENLKNLKLLIKETLVYIESLPKQLRGIENILGDICQDLMQLNGLLFEVLDSEDEKYLKNGGIGSGDFDHAGRQGEIGGSAKSGHGRSHAKTRQDAVIAFKKEGIKVKDTDAMPEIKKEVEQAVKKEEDSAKKIGSLSIKRETKKAYLLEKDNKSFWVQKRWVREDGTLTPAGQKSFEEAETKDEYIGRKKAEEEKKKLGVDFVASWRSDKAIGVDVTLAWSSSVYKKVRLFFPKSVIQPNGRLPTWIVDKKIDEMYSNLSENTRYGAFIEDSGFINDGEEETEKVKNSKEKIYTIDDDGNLFEIEDE